MVGNPNKILSQDKECLYKRPKITKGEKETIGTKVHLLYVLLSLCVIFFLPLGMCHILQAFIT